MDIDKITDSSEYLQEARIMVIETLNNRARPI